MEKHYKKMFIRQKIWKWAYTDLHSEILLD